MTETLTICAQGLVAYAMHPASMLTGLASNIPENLHREQSSQGSRNPFADADSTEYLTDTPDLVGDTFAFLGSEKRDWLAGRFVAVCWDMPELIAREKEIVEGDKLKFRMVM